MLKTDRLLLVPPTDEFINPIIDYYSRNKEHLKLFEPTRPDKFYTESFWQDRIRQIQSLTRNDQQVSYLMTPQNEPQKIIGIINFTSIIRGVFQACYLGYSIDKDFEGKGYMTEALNSAIDYIFKTKNFHRIMANCMATNHRSLSLLDRLGFTREGVAKDYLFINSRWEDHILTALINKKWVLPD